MKSTIKSVRDLFLAFSILLFAGGIVLTSCNTQPTDDDNTEQMEEENASDSTAGEHPAGEHPDN